MSDIFIMDRLLKLCFKVLIFILQSEMMIVKLYLLSLIKLEPEILITIVIRVE